MLQHPYSGAPINESGVIILPIPDASDGLVCHLNALTWNQRRDGFIFAEELWMTIKNFIDNLLDAFEKAVPKRFQNAKQAAP